jgi:alpha-D-xyloside xylohydrolase
MATAKISLALMCLAALAQPMLAIAATFEQQKDGVIVRLEKGAVKLQVCTERIIRVVYDPTGAFAPARSLVIVNKWQSCEFSVREAKDHIELQTASLNVRVANRAGAISFFDKNDELLFRENPGMPKSVTPARVLDENTHHAQLNIKFSAGEGVYGLGQHQNGIMNYRGHEVILTQENTIVAIPFLISTRNYGILLDNYSKIIFHDKEDGTYFWCEVGDVIDYSFIAGSNMDEVIRGYREATGHAPMFGKWAYGYWQSKERYKTQEEVLSIAREYRSRKIPIDNIVQDWQYWGDDVGYWTSMKFDSTRYPDPVEMIRTLHEKYRMRLMISIWPVPGYKTEMFREMQSKGFLYEPFHWTDGHTYDAYNEEARQIYWRYLNEGLFSK